MGFSRADAYRMSYEAQNKSSASVRREADRLMKNPNVATMIAELNTAADTKVINDWIADRTEVLETLTRMMRGEVEADGNRVRAAQLLAQTHGLLKDRTELVVHERPSDEVKTELLRRLNELQKA
tara:strand:- start:113 stop:487 length:375 start_codon:yes stop_codon:yes gene_type:complete